MSKQEYNLLPSIEDRWPVRFPLDTITPTAEFYTHSLPVESYYLYFPQHYKEFPDNSIVSSFIIPEIPMESLIETNPPIDDLIRRQRTMRFPPKNSFC